MAMSDDFEIGDASRRAAEWRCDDTGERAFDDGYVREETEPMIEK
jgi:hypothetical protein